MKEMKTGEKLTHLTCISAQKQQQKTIVVVGLADL